MTNQIKDALINRLSVRYGLLLSAISLVLSIVFRIVDPVLQFTNTWVSLFSVAVIIVLLVVLGLDIRKKIGGYWNFGEAFKSLIIMSVFLVAVSTAYSFVLIKFIDPDLPAKINSATLDKVTATLSNFGTDQAKIDEATKQFQNGEFEAKLQPTLKNEMIALGGGLVLYAIIDLIIAASVKKKAPLLAPLDEEPAA
jgi:hypothetical protein